MNEFERRNQPNDELNVGFGRGWVTFKGRDAITFIIIIALACALGFLIWLCVAANKVAAEVNKETLRILSTLEAHDLESGKWRADIISNQRETITRQDAIIYLLSLSDKERATLHVTMPNTLRQMLRHNQE